MKKVSVLPLSLNVFFLSNQWRKEFFIVWIGTVKKKKTSIFAGVNELSHQKPVKGVTGYVAIT